MSSVQSSVGKLLGDATVDIKDTFDCTVSAIQQAFSSESTVPDYYYQKCQGNKDVNEIPLSPPRTVQIIITPFVAPAPTDVSRTSQPINTEQNNLKPTPQATDTNTKNSDQIEKKIDRVESDVLGESRMIANVNYKLEHEFQDLSKQVNDDFMKIENERTQLSIEKLMQEIGKLHDEEAIHINNTESEFREVFDKLLTKIGKNDTDNIGLKEEIKSALAELAQYKNKTDVEKDLEKWKEEELRNFNEIRDLLKKQEHMFTAKPDETSTKTTNPSTTTETVTSTKATTTEPVVLTTTIPTIIKTASPVKPNDYDSLLSTDQTTLDEALNVFGNSKKTASIMDAIFKSKKPAASVFDYPGLLD